MRQDQIDEIKSIRSQDHSLILRLNEILETCDHKQPNGESAIKDNSYCEICYEDV